MKTRTSALSVLSAVVAISAIAVASNHARADETSAAAAYKDIEATLGFVPGFFKQFPQSGIGGAWTEFKSVQLNPNTKLDGRTKELIGLAVAAQIPCQYCVYFHTAAAKANGASDVEVQEAVAMSAIVRHWSTALNGMQVDMDSFKADVDRALSLAAEKAKTAATVQ